MRLVQRESPPLANTACAMSEILEFKKRSLTSTRGNASVIIRIVLVISFSNEKQRVFLRISVHQVALVRKKVIKYAGDCISKSYYKLHFRYQKTAAGILNITWPDIIDWCSYTDETIATFDIYTVHIHVLKSTRLWIIKWSKNMSKISNFSAAIDKIVNTAPAHAYEKRCL